MNREFIHRHLSTASIFLFALLLMAAVACAGGSDDTTTADNGGETAGETGGGTGDGGNGTPPAPAGGGDDEPADSTCPGNATVVNVTLSEKGSSGKWDVGVDKETVEITMQGRVCWDVSGLEDGYTLTMSGKSGEDNQFPDRSVTPPPTTINSGAPKSAGTFEYDLTLTHDGNEVGKLDPSIIIRPDDGG